MKHSGFTALDPIAIVSGTATFPGLVFSSETSLGWLRSGTSTMALSYGTIYALNGPIGSARSDSHEGLLLNQIGPFNTDAQWQNNYAAKWTFSARSSTNNFWFYNSASSDPQLIIEAATGYSISTRGFSTFTTGQAISPAFAFESERSLGIYRSAASTLAFSYGTVNLNNAILSSLRTTNASGTSATVNDKELRIVAVSVSSAQLAFRSGNTTYVINADATAL